MLAINLSEVLTNWYSVPILLPLFHRGNWRIDDWHFECDLKIKETGTEKSLWPDYKLNI